MSGSHSLSGGQARKALPRLRLVAGSAPARKRKDPTPEQRLRALFRKQDRLSRQQRGVADEIMLVRALYAEKHNLRAFPRTDVLRKVVKP